MNGDIYIYIYIYIYHIILYTDSATQFSLSKSV